MKAGPVLAYEPTHSMATKGATRHSAMTTRIGVTTALPTSGVCDIRRFRPLGDHLCNAQAI
ncbi:hypothetical protein GCM10010384_61280 [Streptomyces djakartensis]|uniref:Uncharacterized protein n=1 Tax=Streptomyces djakartensis TaxID=68193 RepID=A0ABQ3AC39_9ACTN|nr:hypothetical protein GCM10010384_61280 [Streptomyces djakartensis]